MSIASELAMKAEKQPVSAGDKEFQTAEWNREKGAWVFEDGSMGCFTKVRPLLKEMFGEWKLWAYRFEVIN